MPRLLVLDDEPAIGKLVSRAGNYLGLDCRSVTSASDFMEMVADWNPEFVVIDLLVPEKDGVELLRELAEKRVSASIILISAVSPRVLDAAHRAAAEKGLDIVGALNKPFSVAEIKRLLLEAGSGNNAQSSTKRLTSTHFTREELEHAITAREIGIALQPKLECATGRVAGFEALARWHRPEGDVLTAENFISAFERSGLITALSDLVYEQALDWLAGAPVSDSQHFLCLNLSPVMLDDSELGARLAELCERKGFETSRILLELTEGSVWKNTDAMVMAITGLRVHGFRVAVENVGSRFSSLTQLADLPFSEMKIDGSFMKATSGESEAKVIVKSLILLGHNLSLTVVAEGVEDAETDQFLVEAGCDLAQGTYYAPPMSPESAMSWFSSHLP